MTPWCFNYSLVIVLELFVGAERASFGRCMPLLTNDQIISVVVPLLGGKLFRETVPGAKGWVQRWKTPLKLTNVFMFAMIVWQILSRAHDEVTALGLGQAVPLVVVSILLHVM